MFIDAAPSLWKHSSMVVSPAHFATKTYIYIYIYIYMCIYIYI